MAEELQSGPALKQHLVGLSLLGWFVLSALMLGSLAIGHVVSMPEPEGDRLTSLLRELRELRQRQGRDLVVHVIAADCSCTESLFRHLVGHGAAAGADELILFVGQDPAKAETARAAGYRFVSISQEALTAMGLESAPVLAVFDPGDRIRYLGGYYDHPAAANPLDQRLRSALARSETVAPLPIYGCAVSPRLQQAFDPYGLIYQS